MISLLGTAQAMPSSTAKVATLAEAGQYANPSALAAHEADSYAYWEQRTLDQALPSSPLLVSSLRAAASYDPSLYPGITCESWCNSTVKIDRAAAEAAGRVTFPADDVADWNEKCSLLGCTRSHTSIWTWSQNPSQWPPHAIPMWHEPRRLGLLQSPARGGEGGGGRVRPVAVGLNEGHRFGLKCAWLSQKMRHLVQPRLVGQVLRGLPSVRGARRGGGWLRQHAARSVRRHVRHDRERERQPYLEAGDARLGRALQLGSVLCAAWHISNPDRA